MEPKKTTPNIINISTFNLSDFLIQHFNIEFLRRNITYNRFINNLVLGFVSATTTKRCACKFRPCSYKLSYT